MYNKPINEDKAFRLRDRDFMAEVAAEESIGERWKIYLESQELFKLVPTALRDSYLRLLKEQFLGQMAILKMKEEREEWALAASELRVKTNEIERQCRKLEWKIKRFLNHQDRLARTDGPNIQCGDNINDARNDPNV